MRKILIELGCEVKDPEKQKQLETKLRQALKDLVKEGMITEQDGIFMPNYTETGDVELKNQDSPVP